MEPELRRLVKELMGQLERKEALAEEKLATVREAFEKASHDGPCPCGSGRKFCECCKLDWVILRDRPAVEVPEECKVAAFPDKVDRESLDEVEWLFRIGRHASKGMVLEATPAGMRVPPAQMAEMLLTAYHVTNHNGILASVQALLEQRRPAGPAVRRAFGK